MVLVSRIKAEERNIHNHKNKTKSKYHESNQPMATCSQAVCRKRDVMLSIILVVRIV